MSDPAAPLSLGLQAYLADAAMAAVWRDEAIVADMLRFEAALAAAQAECGVIDPADAQAIAAACAELTLAAGALGAQARVASTLAIPLVQALRRAVKAQRESATARVHFGATSQDVVDTAMMLRAAEALALLDTRLAAIGDALAALAQAHAATPMTGRTLLQAALPIPFGAKAAVWLSGVARSRRALRSLQRTQLYLQYGGAAGTLYDLGEHAHAVSRSLARALGLQNSPIPWHAQRDIPSRLGAELAVLCGVLAKIGTDVALLMQAEVGEAREPAGEGRGTSSAMPHKRNPVGSMLMIEAAQRAAGLQAVLLAQLPAEHERAVGGWQNQLFVLRDIFMAAGSAAAAAQEVCCGLEVDTARMQHNLARNAQGAFEPALHAHAARQMIDDVLADWKSLEN